VTANVGSPRDDDLLAVLLDGLSYAQVAAEVGCSKRTVERRMSDQMFRARVVAAAKARAEQRHAERLERLALAEERAEDVLVELLDAEAPMVRLKAVQLLKDLRTREVERAEIVEKIGPRLDRLEVALGLADEISS
jgi:FixJ family two-component response regulator